MKKALFFLELLKNKLVRCELCPNYCIIKENSIGKCGVRKNINGKLYSLVYGRPCSIALDPIEKKPFYHFLPSSQTLSIATFGCNLACLHCQNYSISQEFIEKEIESLTFVEPEKIIEEAKEKNLEIICYTYTEPTIFYEYMLDIARLARKNKMRNIIVSNGYINKKPLLKLLPYLDAANIDLKSISPKFYLEICKVKLEPILETIKLIAESSCWLEITNLIIPGLNDKSQLITRLIHWIKALKNGIDIPLHFTAFFPAYKLIDLPPTPEPILLKAREKAMKEGLRWVYAGNIVNLETNSTYCIECGKLIIKRSGFKVIEFFVEDGKCKFCKAKIAGVWK